jgi:hypothetical protein
MPNNAEEAVDYSNSSPIYAGSSTTSLEFAITANEVYEPADPRERSEWEYFKSLTVGVEPECIVRVPTRLEPRGRIPHERGDGLHGLHRAVLRKLAHGGGRVGRRSHPRQNPGPEVHSLAASSFQSWLIPTPAGAARPVDHWRFRAGGFDRQQIIDLYGTNCTAPRCLIGTGASIGMGEECRRSALVRGEKAARPTKDDRLRKLKAKSRDQLQVSLEFERSWAIRDDDDPEKLRN